MPELPEVETVRRGLEPAMVGARFTKVAQRRPDLRFPFPERFAEASRARRSRPLSRRAKYLLADLSSGEVLVMHLGMSGPLPGDARRQNPRCRASSTTSTGAWAPTTMWSSSSRTARPSPTTTPAASASWIWCRARGSRPAKHFAGMGIEPLGNELSGETIARLFQGKRTPLKAALLDQRLIAGLGNIYVCEALFRTGLHPEAPAGSLATKTGKPTEKAHRLADIIRDVLAEAVEAGGSTLRDHAQVDGSLGYFQHSFRVYDREGEACVTPGCTGTVARLVQSGRSTFYCPVCQKRSRA